MAIQEPVTGPRFGFDPAGAIYKKPPAGGWADLSWGHVASSAEALAAMGNLRLARRCPGWTARAEDGIDLGPQRRPHGGHRVPAALPAAPAGRPPAAPGVVTPRRRPPRKKVPDRPAPVDPIEPPDIDLPGVPTGPVLVDRLDEGLPLVLFPVRLATRFHRGDGPEKRADRALGAHLPRRSSTPTPT